MTLLQSAIVSVYPPVSFPRFAISDFEYRFKVPQCYSASSCMQVIQQKITSTAKDLTTYRITKVNGQSFTVNANTLEAIKVKVKDKSIY